MSDAILSLRQVTKTFKKGSLDVPVLRGIDLDIFPGDALSIVGSSGAGKSTLLHILGTLDAPTSGEVTYRGKKVGQIDGDELAQFRNRHLGFVFQFHHLLSEFSAYENVLLPARIAGVKESEARSKADELFSILGISARKSHFPSEMSGGEQQRVAIARALIRQPEILLADEPTGNLDSENGRMIQDLFFALRTRFQVALVIVTHDLNFAARFPRRLRLHDGRWN